MAMHRFFTSCDQPGCLNRSDEYTAYPRCTDCGLDTCPTCAQSGTLTDADVDQPETVLCRSCWQAGIDADYAADGDLETAWAHAEEKW